MRKALVNNTTGELQNIVMVDPNNLPEAPEGYRMEDETGGVIGQRWTGSAWEYPLSVLEARVRAGRDARLLEVDAIAGNALRWAALNADTQAAWATYRQALLDVPQQAGFPNTVAWPTEPTGDAT
jgi:hypothetical protein